MDMPAVSSMRNFNSSHISNEDITAKILKSLRRKSPTNSMANNVPIIFQFLRLIVLHSERHKANYIIMPLSPINEVRELLSPIGGDFRATDGTAPDIRAGRKPSKSASPILLELLDGDRAVKDVPAVLQDFTGRDFLHSTAELPERGFSTNVFRITKKL